ncbi:hypothetical protein RB614_08635 [Phytohabitans sp. ZYX-F-186]|uniref:Uncharacterized protein n=1 Tax=Phytohabitans maris TaxID=3071409 RepID=A0ABU0ZBZ6_9ACTN|nr:hypothetical protein [Phytohabitans sp. ZYX-F-186]MDQ7904589.1 hypothetical protein [Phytohabitans sp. ZYX-F-186]
MGILRKLAGACLAAALATAGLAAPAQAAVPDGHGFVLWNGAAVVPSGTWPPATTVTAFGGGFYEVVFPGQAAKGGVVHVTAISGRPVWCQALKWGFSGADQIAYIGCFRPGSFGIDTPFTAVFASSSPPDGVPGHYGYVHADAAATVVSEYNSAVGGGNTVAPAGGPGEYVVRFPALGTPGPNDGSLQVTAVNSDRGAHCQIPKWRSSPGGQDVLVFCFDGTGTPFDTGFTLSYQLERSLFGPAYPPKFFGYIWNMPPPPAPNPGPPATNFNSQLGPGANGLAASGLGLTLVGFRGLAQRPDTVQVSTSGQRGEFCNLQAPWSYSGTTVLVRNVACYTPAGARVDTGSFTSYNSEF